jgi:hypothetical protein
MVNVNNINFGSLMIKESQKNTIINPLEIKNALIDDNSITIYDKNNKQMFEKHALRLNDAKVEEISTNIADSIDNPSKKINVVI